MARRRRHEEEHENHERWLVSYADFITLLFAFFVVMYSLSSINEGKYRVLSDSIVQAFRSLNINESGQQIILPPVAVAPVVRPQPPAPSQLEESAEAVRRQTAQQMRSMAEDIRRVLAPLTRSGPVSVWKNFNGARSITATASENVLLPPVRLWGRSALLLPASRSRSRPHRLLPISTYRYVDWGFDVIFAMHCYRQRVAPDNSRPRATPTSALWRTTPPTRVGDAIAASRS